MRSLFIYLFIYYLFRARINDRRGIKFDSIGRVFLAASLRACLWTGETNSRQQRQQTRQRPLFALDGVKFAHVEEKEEKESR